MREGSSGTGKGDLTFLLGIGPPDKPKRHVPPFQTFAGGLEQSVGDYGRAGVELARVEFVSIA